MISFPRFGASVLILALSGTSLAQSRSNPTTPRNPKTEESKAVTQQLNLNSENLGPNFRGHDVVAVFSAIKSSPWLTPKSEFESTVNFDRRRNTFVDRPLYSNLKPSDYFAFVIGGDAVEVNYDADFQLLSFTLTAQTIKFLLEDGSPTLDAIPIRHAVHTRGQYLGSNAFGATTVVTRATSEDYGVAFVPDTWLFGDSHAFSYHVPMRPEDARVIKTIAKLLLICRLSEPWLRQQSYRVNPTIDIPSESQFNDRYLQVAPEQLWLFNARTGQVIVKLTEQFVRSQVGVTSAAARALAEDGGYLSDSQVLADKGQASRCAVLSTPSGATVYVDGLNVGVTPLHFFLLRTDKPRTVAVKLEGYQAFEQHYIPNGKTIPIDVRLQNNPQADAPRN